MTPEERSLLERTHKLAEENNEILRKMRRSTQFANIMRVAYWVIIIGMSVGAYYLIQPYVDLIMNINKSGMTNIQDAASSLKDLF